MPIVFQQPRDLLQAVGQSLGRSAWFLIDRARVELFADATNLSVQTDLSATAAVPEYLTLSLVNLFLPQLIDVRGVALGVNVGCGNVRFPAPVPLDARIRGSGEIIDAREERDGVQVVIRVTVELEGSASPACVADTISRYYPT